MTFSPFDAHLSLYNDTSRINKLKSPEHNPTFERGSIEPIDSGGHGDE
jgi:hypothetical protein